MGHEWSGYDPQKEPKVKFSPSEADRIIICTPTEKHVQDIRDLLKYQKPILCEKPVCKDRMELGDLLSDIQQSKTIVQMINQYNFLNYSRTREASSEYSYYKSGADGIYWDCINIIAAANGELTINNKSPVWKCKINGDDLDIAEMDFAYMDNISHFLTHPMDGTEHIWFAHDRVLKLLELKDDQSTNRHTS